ncbi:MAG: hypothetical protein JSV56_03295 [Methanomassiliicoccales archaeon]|nr:MAG: hypothetical protein JSV56_03295 [Methanomassiliicoccales archaeon]
MAEKGLAKALKRKMGLVDDILTQIETKKVESSLLMNPSRLRIFEFVCNFPCSHLRAISRALNFSCQNVKWHLRKLIDGGMITEGSLGKRKIFSPLRNYIKKDECEVFTLLGNDEIRRVYILIDTGSDMTQKSLCEAADIYQQRLSRHLIIMENSGLIYHEKIGRKKIYNTTNRVKELEASFKAKKGIFENTLIKVLRADGVNPRIIRSNADKLLIELDIGGGEKTVLRINRNPISTLIQSSAKV